MKIIQSIDFWLAGFLPFWRAYWNERQEMKIALDSIGFGVSFSKIDLRGRIIHMPAMRCYSPPASGEQK